ncbi:hypothetical protein CEXT_702001, partial [Caerostris extrusa]
KESFGIIFIEFDVHFCRNKECIMERSYFFWHLG